MNFATTGSPRIDWRDLYVGDHMQDSTRDFGQKPRNILRDQGALVSFCS